MKGRDTLSVRTTGEVPAGTSTTLQQLHKKWDKVGRSDNARVCGIFTRS